MTSDTLSTVGSKSSQMGNRQPSFFARYRGFLLSTNTLVAIANGVLLLAGAAVQWLLGNTPAANVLYIASALIGAFPVFILAINGIRKGNLTAGVMVSVAMIAAPCSSANTAPRPSWRS